MTAPESVPGWDEAVETAAEAAFTAFGWNVDRKLAWADAPEEFRVTFRKVVTAAAPVLLAAHEKEVRAKVAAEIERAADDHSRNIALMAGVPYDPDRHDGMVASGIRRAARIAEGAS